MQSVNLTVDLNYPDFRSFLVRKMRACYLVAATWDMGKKAGGLKSIGSVGRGMRISHAKSDLRPWEARETLDKYWGSPQAHVRRGGDELRQGCPSRAEQFKPANRDSELQRATITAATLVALRRWLRAGRSCHPIVTALASSRRTSGGHKKDGRGTSNKLLNGSDSSARRGGEGQHPASEGKEATPLQDLSPPPTIAPPLTTSGRGEAISGGGGERKAYQRCGRTSTARWHGEPFTQFKYRKRKEEHEMVKETTIGPQEGLHAVTAHS